MAPTEYVGAIMELCQERRGTLQGMEYMEETRVLITYELPLNEIIYDFFDALKSRTRGYASFDYELIGYQSDLVKLDILLNGEVVDALSLIVHKDKAYTRGRRIAEKLKELIPRQMFEIPIQAAIGTRSLPGNHKSVEKGRISQMLWWRYFPKEKALGKQKEGKSECARWDR